MRTPLRRCVVLVAVVPLSAAPSSADTLRIFAAGSATNAFSDLLRRFPAGPDGVAPVFGSPGCCRRSVQDVVRVEVE